MKQNRLLILVILLIIGYNVYCQEEYSSLPKISTAQLTALNSKGFNVIFQDEEENILVVEIDGSYYHVVENN